MMKKRHLLILSLILISSCSDDAAEQVSDTSEKIGLVTENDTSVRIEPFLFSSKVIELEKGSRVHITSSSPEMTSINRKKSYWYRVRLENGMEGWIFGSNMKLFGKDDESAAKRFADSLKEGDIENIMAKLHGKWWSVNKNGEYTDYNISLFNNGEYYTKDKNGTEFKGKYTVDPVASTLTFDQSIPLGNKLNYSNRSGSYSVEFMGNQAFPVKFQKISPDPESPDPEITTTDTTGAEAPATNPEIKVENGAADTNQ